MTTKYAVRRKRGERGHAIVEGALTLLPFFAMILGIADFAMVMFLIGLFQEDARNAARAVSTYNLTYNGNTYSSQTALAQQMMIDGSLGFISTSNVSTYVQVNYYFPDDLTTPATAARLPHTWTDSKGQTQTISYVNAPGNIAEVRVVSFPWNWMVPLPNFMPGKSISIGSQGVDILGGLPVGSTTPPTP